MKVNDAMSASVKTIRPRASLKQAAAMLAEHRIGGLPVVDDTGVPLGVISEADILVKERAVEPRGRLWRLFHRREANALAMKAQARTVAEAMNEPAFTIEADWPVSQAAEQMLERDIGRLLLVDGDRLVGILTRHDLVRAFARSDGEIAREIRDEAFRGISWTEDITFEVEKGEVTLRGKVDTRFDAELLPDLIRSIPGVVGVDSELKGWDPSSNKEVAVAVHRD